jgi:hypothetical protein
MNCGACQIGTSASYSSSFRPGLPFECALLKKPSVCLRRNLLPGRLVPESVCLRRNPLLGPLVPESVCLRRNPLLGRLVPESVCLRRNPLLGPLVPESVCLPQSAARTTGTWSWVTKPRHPRRACCSTRPARCWSACSTS